MILLVIGAPLMIDASNLPSTIIILLIMAQRSNVPPVVVPSAGGNNIIMNPSQVCPRGVSSHFNTNQTISVEIPFLNAFGSRIFIYKSPSSNVKRTLHYCWGIFNTFFSAWDVGYFPE